MTQFKADSWALSRNSKMSPWPYLALIMAGVCWGLGFPLAKLSMRDIGASQMILLRLAVASIVALPFVLRSSRTRAAILEPKVLLAGLLYGPAFLVQFEGVARATVSTSALLVGALPVLVASTARVFFGETVSRLGWIGIGAATAGAAVLAGRHSGGSTVVGILLVLASLVLCVGWILLLRRVTKRVDAIAASCVIVLVATLVDLPIVLVMRGEPTLHISLLAWTGIVGQGLLSTIVAIVAWQLGASQVSAASSGVFLNLEPLVGAICGVIFFGDAMTLNLLLGGAAILFGSVLVALSQDTDRR